MKNKDTFAIYVERTDPNKDMDQNETDDESKPLLNKKEVREVVDQISRLGREEQDLIAESESLSASAKMFKKMKPKKPFWRKVCCCGCDEDQYDNT